MSLPCFPINIGETKKKRGRKKKDRKRREGQSREERKDEEKRKEKEKKDRREKKRGGRWRRRRSTAGYRSPPTATTAHPPSAPRAAGRRLVSCAHRYLPSLITPRCSCCMWTMEGDPLFLFLSQPSPCMWTGFGPAYRNWAGSDPVKKNLFKFSFQNFVTFSSFAIRLFTYYRSVFYFIKIRIRY